MGRGVFRILGFVPEVGGIISFVASVWVLIAAIIGIRAAIDFSTIRAVITALIGWLQYFSLMYVLAWVGFGGLPQPLQ